MLRPLALASVLAALSLAACTDDGEPDPAPASPEGRWQLLPHDGQSADTLPIWTFADGMLTQESTQFPTETAPYTFTGGILEFHPVAVTGVETFRIYASVGQRRMLVDEARPVGTGRTVGVTGVWSEIQVIDGQATTTTFDIDANLGMRVTEQGPGDTVARESTGYVTQLAIDQYQLVYGPTTDRITRYAFALNGNLGFALFERL